MKQFLQRRVQQLNSFIEQEKRKGKAEGTGRKGRWEPVRSQGDRCTHMEHEIFFTSHIETAASTTAEIAGGYPASRSLFLPIFPNSQSHALSFRGADGHVFPNTRTHVPPSFPLPPPAPGEHNDPSSIILFSELQHRVSSTDYFGWLLCCPSHSSPQTSCIIRLFYPKYLFPPTPHPFRTPNLETGGDPEL